MHVRNQWIGAAIQPQSRQLVKSNREVWSAKINLGENPSALAKYEKFRLNLFCEYFCFETIVIIFVFKFIFFLFDIFSYASIQLSEIMSMGLMVISCETIHDYMFGLIMSFRGKTL